MRTKKAIKNTIMGLLLEIVTLVSAFIVPRLVLTTFGSEYNGITQVALQFLSVIALFAAGIDGVARYALYKPLAGGNTEEISIVVKTVDSFYRKISIIFMVILFAVAAGFPFAVKEDFSWLFAFTLILIIGIGSFAQYFWGNAYITVPESDQRQSFTYSVKIAISIISTAVLVILINAGYGIHAVRLGGAAVACLSPIFIRFYVKRTYKLKTKGIKPDNNLIKQRWDNFGRQMAGFIRANTDLIIISLFLNIYEVSVYAVYKMVAKGIGGLINPFLNGQGSAFGDMIARGENENIKKNLRITEQIAFSVTTALYAVMGFMIVPFVMLYTTGVDDVNYMRIGFAFALTFSEISGRMASPYEMIVSGFGHFKQTRNFAFIEGAVNIVVSLIMVNIIGLPGVLIGTIAANALKSVYYSIYVSEKLVLRSRIIFFKRAAISLTITSVSLFASTFFGLCGGVTDWILRAALVSSATFIVVLLSELLFFKKDMLNLYLSLKTAIMKRR